MLDLYYLQRLPPQVTDLMCNIPIATGLASFCSR